jgi:hypothetical protein
MSDEMSDEAVGSSIGPGMGVCHLETGVQVIIPAQVEPQRIVEALEAILNALKNNVGEGIGCSDLAWMTASEVGAMLLVGIETDDGPEDAVNALHAAAEEFVVRTDAAKAEMDAQVLEEDKEGRVRTPRDDEADEDLIEDEQIGGA